MGIEWVFGVCDWDELWWLLDFDLWLIEVWLVGYIECSFCGSFYVWYVDVGLCNGCEFEL